MSDLPKRVSIDEEGPREGIQSEPAGIPLADKVRLATIVCEFARELRATAARTDIDR